MKPAGTLFSLLISLMFAIEARAASLADLAFLGGDWTSDRSGFVIEESWTDAKAGVLLGMSRGVQNGSIRFLRFAIVEQLDDTVVMRFRRYNADYTSWEAEGPSVMRLASVAPNQAVFEAIDPASDVQRIVYRANDNGTIGVIAHRVDENGPYLVEFTLRRVNRAGD